MRRLVVALILVGGLAVGTEPSSLAQSPSPDVRPSPNGVDASGRFILPEGGYAVSVPEGWRVEVYPYGDVPRRVPYVEAQEPREGSASDAVAYCWIRVFRPCVHDGAGSCATSIDEAAAQEVAWWESGTGGLVPDIVESVALVLPAGYAVRVRVKGTQPDRDRAYYRITDGQALAILGCHAAHGPDDHWLSIAETFEFLPVEA